MKKFYRCDHCGIIVGIVEEGGGTLVCCGEPMRALEAEYHRWQRRKSVFLWWK